MNNLEHTSLTELKTNRDYAKAEIANLTASIKAVDAELVRRYSDAGMAKLTGLGKETGTTKLELGDGTKLKVEVSKTVKWDNALLQTLASGMTWERVSHFFKIDFSVSEAMYNAIEPSDMKDAMRRARTTKSGDMKIEFAD